MARQTRTFLASDIEGSTRRWVEDEAAMAESLARHDALVARAVEAVGGDLFKHTGDGFFAAFEDPFAAVAVAVDIQTSVELPLRMAMATGPAEQRDDDWFGGILSKTARLLDAGSGGQVLVGDVTAGLVGESIAEGVGLRGLGRHRFRDLHEAYEVFQLLAPGLVAEFPPIRSLDAFPNNLPVQMTSFVGREDELGTVLGLLDEARMVSLTGVGGVGKTRLALATAAAALDRFAGGVWFVELAPIAEPSLIAAETMAAMGAMADGRDPLDIIVSRCTDPTLLVFDNCEHLIDDVAKLAENLLRGAPELSVIATSREALGVMGEAVYRVPSLRGEDGLEEAIALFASRARLVDPDFVVDDTNRADVEQICRRLDGIPLAIELATARLRILDPAGIAARLDDRFRFLTGGARTALPRQRTLAAMMDWSYGLLSEKEQMLLRRLAVFAGGFSLEAAEAVCSDEDIADFEVLDLLDRLVACSLLSPEPNGRFRMLETVRQYAVDRLLDSGDMDRWRDRHAAFFERVAGTIDEGLLGPDADRVSAALVGDHDNFRLAMGYSLESGEADRAGRIAEGLYRFWQSLGNWDEAYSWYRRIVDLVTDDVLRGWLANSLMLCLSNIQGRYDEWKHWKSEFERLLPEPAGSPFKQVQWRVARGNALSGDDLCREAYAEHLTAAETAAEQVPYYTVPLWSAVMEGIELAEPPRFDWILRRLEEAAGSSGQAEHLALSYGFLGLGRIAVGDWEGARDAHRLQGEQIDRLPVTHQARAPFLGAQTRFQIRDGDLEAARESLRRYRLEMETSPGWELDSHEVEASLELAAGDVVAALRALEAGIDGANAYHVKNLLETTVLALHRAGDLETAAALLRGMDRRNTELGLRELPWAEDAIDRVRPALAAVDPDVEPLSVAIEDRAELRETLLTAVRRALEQYDA